MRKLIPVLLAILLLSCNNSATPTTPPSDKDNTNNNDTGNKTMKDSSRHETRMFDSAKNIPL